MQWFGALILLSLLILLFLAAIYFARGQTSHKRPYSSWSDVLGPRSGRAKVMDMAEQVSNEIARGQGRRPHRKRSR